MTPLWLRRSFLCASAAALLSGCASVRVVDSQVQSWSTLTAVPAPPTYRLEKLPSQQASDQAFAPIEALAHQALQRAGLRRDDAGARLVAQVGVRSSSALPDWPHSPPMWGWGAGWGRHPGLRAGVMLRETPPTLHRREASLVLRDATTQQVVYETSALHEDVWTDDPALFGVLFDAALSGFPQPPTGVRQVHTTVPR
ncbi:MAG: DUF4136 domain-containing protein [Giesbergeria sp.]|jgi:hypothetical protein|nr:DUF4136 domain-containing protein [Giesbergeria sp.]